MRKLASTTKSCALGSSCQKASSISFAKRPPSPLSHSNWNYSQTPLLPPEKRFSPTHRWPVNVPGFGAHANSTMLLNMASSVTDSATPRGYGGTVCNIPGHAETKITTGGCNRPCTEAHEAVHFNDIKSCCEAANLRAAFTSPEEQARVRDTWNRWVDDFRPIAECRAYDVSVPCLNRLFAEKKCDRESMTHDEHECCGEIDIARNDDMHGQRDYNCDKASRQVPRCPFGPSGPQSSMFGDDSVVDQQAAINQPADQQPADQQPDQALAQAYFRRR